MGRHRASAIAARLLRGVEMPAARPPLKVSLDKGYRTSSACPMNRCSLARPSALEPQIRHGAAGILFPAGKVFFGPAPTPKATKTASRRNFFPTGVKYDHTGLRTRAVASTQDRWEGTMGPVRMAFPDLAGRLATGCGGRRFGKNRSFAPYGNRSSCACRRVAEPGRPSAGSARWCAHTGF